MKDLLCTLCIALILCPIQIFADTYDTHTLVKIYVLNQEEKNLINQLNLDVTNAREDWVEALLTDEEFQLLDEKNLRYEVMYEKMMKERASRAVPGFCTSTPWPCYYAASTFNTSNPPSGSLMEYLLSHHNNYPTITRLFDYGDSQDGTYDLIAIKVTDNPDVEENEPELRIMGNIHGDEASSMMVTCAALDWILSNYGSDPVATKLVDEAELWFIPLSNPYGLANQTRYNSRGVDLNRNFWGPIGCDEPPEWSESETAAIRDLTEIGLPADGETQKLFVTSLSFHSGEICFNAVYNYTSTATPDEPNFFEARTGGPQGDADPSPNGLAQAYMDGNTTSGFWYTNGYDWYQTLGDTNDWSYYVWSDLDTTLEVTTTKWPDSTLIPSYTDEHTQAVINYLYKSFQGISGIMSDAGTPLDGDVVATCTANCPSYVGTGRIYKEVFTDPDIGDFHRVLLPGTYELECNSSGYTSYSISDIVVTADQTIWVNCTWNTPDLVYQSHVIDDNSGGNNDGIVNPGETIVIPITVLNTGELSGTNFQGILSTMDTNVTVIDAAASFPDLTTSSSGPSLPDHFSFSVDSGTLNEHQVVFDLDWTATGGYSGTTSFTVIVYGPPVISNVQVTNIKANSALITWDTDVPATSQVTYGTSIPPSSLEEDLSYTTSHSIQLIGLSDCTTYYYAVTSENSVGYSATDDNSGTYYQFSTYMATTVFTDDMESGSSLWTADSPWAISTESSLSPTHAWSDSPGGNYSNNINISLTSISFDLSSLAQADLTFWHTYDFESGYDYGYVEVSTNGTTWDNLGTFTGTESTWTEASYDLSSYLGNPNVQIQFRIDTDGYGVNDGWHIDDVSIGYAQPCVPSAEYDSHVFYDDCPTGGSGDADGILDAGETIEFQIDISNGGSGDLTNVWAELSSTTSGVTIIDNQADYPDILEGTTETSLPPHFTINLAQSIICGTTIDFDLDMYCSEGTFNGSFSEIIGVIVPGNGTALDEDFSGGIPGTWTIVDGGSGGGDAATWTTDNPGGRSATSPMSDPFAIVDSDEAGSSATQDEQLITPVLDLSAATSVTLEFDQYFYYYSSGGDEYGDVDIQSSLTSGSWTNIFRNYGSSSPNPDHQSIDITAYAAGANDVQIRFYYYNGDYDWYWMIDNILITYEAPGGCEMNTCDTGGTVEEVPNGMSGNPATVDISGNDVVLTFDPATGATHYNVYRGSLDNLSTTGLYDFNTKVTEETCAGSPDTTIVDSGAATDGNNYYYLINGNNGSCEGTFGYDSTGTSREAGFWPSNACYSLCP